MVKKIIAILLSMMLLCACFVASAEDDQVEISATNFYVDQANFAEFLKSQLQLDLTTEENAPIQKAVDAGISIFNQMNTSIIVQDGLLEVLAGVGQTAIFALDVMEVGEKTLVYSSLFPNYALDITSQMQGKSIKEMTKPTEMEDITNDLAPNYDAFIEKMQAIEKDIASEITIDAVTYNEVQYDSVTKMDIKLSDAGAFYLATEELIKGNEALVNQVQQNMQGMSLEDLNKQAQALVSLKGTDKDDVVLNIDLYQTENSDKMCLVTTQTASKKQMIEFEMTKEDDEKFTFASTMDLSVFDPTMQMSVTLDGHIVNEVGEITMGLHMANYAPYIYISLSKEDDKQVINFQIAKEGNENVTFAFANTSFKQEAFTINKMNDLPVIDVAQMDEETMAKLQADVMNNGLTALMQALYQADSQNTQVLIDALTPLMTGAPAVN